MLTFLDLIENKRQILDFLSLRDPIQNVRFKVIYKDWTFVFSLSVIECQSTFFSIKLPFDIIKFVLYLYEPFDKLLKSAPNLIIKGQKTLSSRERIRKTGNVEHVIDHAVIGFVNDQI